MAIRFEPFWFQCTQALKQTLFATQSDTKSWEFWSFTEVLDCPQIQIPYIICVQKEAHITLIRHNPFSEPSACLSKCLGKRTPPGSPTGLFWTEFPISRVFFYVSLQFLINACLIKRNFALLSKAVIKEGPSCSLKRGLNGNSPPFPGPYLAYTSWLLVKEPFLQVPLRQLPQRETLHFQIPSSSVPQSPGK